MSTTEAPPAEPETAEPANSADGSVREKAEQQQLSLLPEIDGRSRTLLRLSFSGSIDLEPHDSRDAELAKRLQLGANIAMDLGGILIEGIVRSKRDGTRTDQIGYVQDVRHTIAIEIHSIQHPETEADRNRSRD